MNPNAENLNTGRPAEVENGVTVFARDDRTVGGVTYTCKAIHTHFVERGEDYVGLFRQYVLPIWQEGDIVFSSEKVAAMCQDNTVQMSDVKLGFWAKFLSKFATRTTAGIGMDEPYKLQLAINMKGLPRILWAAIAGAVCRLFGRRGVFYEIAGQDVAGIDGFYSHSSFEVYHTMAVLMPENPEALCRKVYEETGVSTVLVDANDINQELLATSPDLADRDPKELLDLIRDNPAGQDDELTPFILIRKKK